MPVLFSPSVGPVSVSIVERENHESTIEITESPIETGASVADHAYRNPNRVTLLITSEGAVATYGALKRLQESRVPFTLVTGLYIYSSMLIKSLSPSRDAAFSSVFNGTVELQEAIIVGTSYVAGQGASLAGQQGGANSIQAATPTPANTSGSVTRIRAANTVARGDNRMVDVGTVLGAPF